MNEHTAPATLNGDEDRRARSPNREALEAAGFDLFPAARFHPSHRVKELRDLFLVQEDMEPADRPSVRVAGRLASIRHVGGIWFADLGRNSKPSSWSSRRVTSIHRSGSVSSTSIWLISSVWKVG